MVDPRTMHLSSPILRKSDSCSSPPDSGSGFSVILRQGEHIGPNTSGTHDSLSPLQQRYSSHPRLISVSQSRPEEGLYSCFLY